MRNSNQANPIVIGSLVVIFLNLVIGIICLSIYLHFSTGYDGLFYFIILSMIGIAQLVYVIPVLVVLRLLGRWELMKGVIIGGLITGLLNLGGCFLMQA
ncbi:hypothetical protein BJP36_05065 [Moorena producens JHB]|uniref:Uncharacterized protein n=1 Tax=Moorena producens (strain JHB) TaxID=1454205 RepID=A0A1D9GA40_MOOP1|nr:hypothetical protein [Moorena producens]AOY84516.2 hypothetical protein BJP36_05065 [Moorena producens JHB]